LLTCLRKKTRCQPVVQVAVWAVWAEIWISKRRLRISRNLFKGEFISPLFL
jgi:hypothetical protein